MRKANLVLATLMLVTGVTGVAAQRADFWRDSTQRIEARIQTLRDSMASSDSNVVDVTRRGDIVVSATVGEEMTAMAVLDEFARVRSQFFGSAMPARGGFQLRLRIEREPVMRGGAQRFGSVVLTGLPNTGDAVHAERLSSPARAANAVVDWLGDAMFANPPFALDQWLPHRPQLSMPPGERRRLAMYTFVTAMGPMQRSCIVGDIAACKHAFEVPRTTQPNAGPVFDLFLKNDLLLSTLEHAGPEAWTRFISSASRGIDVALAAAAGVPVDSSIARWRASLLASRPVDASMGERAAITLAWAGLMVAVAIGASRWL